MSELLDHVIARIVLGQIRHWVTVLGASLVTKGLLTSDQNNQMIGAVMVVVPLLFSAYDKMQAQKAKDAAVLAAAQKKVDA